MERLRVSELITATGGELVRGDADAWVSGITTDSRRAEAGQFFVPLAGERFDGHDFIVDALRAGASGTFVARGRSVSDGGPLRDGAPSARRLPVTSEPIYIAVDDTFEALHRLAHYYRRKFDVPVVAVTGSVGKTTTKDTIASVLSEKFRTLKTWRNYNNEVGVPLTLFQLEREHEALVLELGMRAPGEIARLARMAEPSIGVVTNVSEVHVETLGSLGAIARAKGELVEALTSDGLAVLNGDDVRVRQMAARTKAAPITFGRTAACDVWADDVETEVDGTPTFTLRWRGDGELPVPGSASRPGRGAPGGDGPHRRRLHVNVPGAHHVWSAMAAAICGRRLGLEWEEIARGLERVERSGLRMEVLERAGVSWINDAYNASPLSVRASLGTLVALADGRGRPVAVLGDMLELGEVSERAHREIGSEVARLHIPLLVTVGPAARWIAEEAARARPQPEVHPLSSVEEAAAVLREDGRLQPGDCVLLKASRGMALERILELSSKGDGL